MTEPPPPSELEQELDQFRAEWRQEINHAKHGSTSSATQSPVQLYDAAVRLEQQGKLDEALALYRRAFRLDSHVDRLWELEQRDMARQKKKQNAELDNEERNQLVSSLNKLSVSVAPTVTGSLASLISSFPPGLRFLPEDESKHPPILNSLPSELIIHVLSFLDVPSLERFAAVCRYARVLSADSTLWRAFVERVYVIHQLQDACLDTLLLKYEGDFRRLFIQVPRVRFDGVYIAACHYVRAGLSENRWVSVSHLITYHRFLRFLPDGRVISLLANDDYTPQQIVPMLKPSLRMKGLYIGNWTVHGTTVHIVNLADPDSHSHISINSLTKAPISGTPTAAVSTIPTSKPTNHSFYNQHTHLPPQSSSSSSSSRHHSQSHIAFRMALTLSSRPVVGRWNKLQLDEYVSVDTRPGYEGEESSLLSTWKNIHSPTTGGGSSSVGGAEKEKPFWFSRVKAWA